MRFRTDLVAPIAFGEARVFVGVRTSALNYEVWNDAMESQTVVVMRAHELDEARDSHRRLRGQQLDLDGADARQLNHRARRQRRHVFSSRLQWISMLRRRPAR